MNFVSLLLNKNRFSMKDIRVCPNCYSTLKHNKRNIGGGSNKWLLCPSCGLREKEDSFISTQKESIVGEKHNELNKYIKYVTWSTKFN